eukprot:CAMPEP_0178442460 /NCGR_PEP_ID=MMETSP0689_2-20121128/38176_1 /TAXON_ID=160604 /ORGANISM="Amphidinium massartii, Strain CS-259" /LENGTH=59 /DNA_ID=CAMNT_0020066007 /DNA_START=28 /DNA_END=204 /DNA_ORIENTATION=+
MALYTGGSSACIPFAALALLVAVVQASAQESPCASDLTQWLTPEDAFPRADEPKMLAGW